MEALEFVKLEDAVNVLFSSWKFRYVTDERSLETHHLNKKVNFLTYARSRG